MYEKCCAKQTDIATLCGLRSPVVQKRSHFYRSTRHMTYKYACPSVYLLGETLLRFSANVWYELEF